MDKGHGLPSSPLLIPARSPILAPLLSPSSQLGALGLRRLPSANSDNSTRSTERTHNWKHPQPKDGVHDVKPYIGVTAVVAMTFFNVSGGPWGSEDLFSSSNPITGCLGILVFALFFCLPQILITAELSCALPTNGGYSIWVREAFGDFWCFQETYWQWVSGVADAAVYPVLICDTMLTLAGRGDAGKTEVWLWRILATTLLSLPTLISIASVPLMLIVFALVTTAPVMLFVAIGLGSVNYTVWLQAPRKPMNFAKYVNVLFWNLEGWDCISTCTALIDNPREKIIPRGLLIGLVFTTLQYLLVLMVAAGISAATFPWQSWNDGTLPSIGSAMGPWMSALLLVASVVGNAGQYMSEFMEDSYLLQGAADLGIVPRLFSWVLPRSQAPYMANAAQYLVLVALVTFDFSEILVFDNFFCATAVGLEFAAFIVLRIRQPDLPRPFRVPQFCLPLLLPALMLLAVVWYHCFAHSWFTMFMNLSAFLGGVPYGLWVAGRARRDHEAGHRSALDELLEDEPPRSERTFRVDSVDECHE